MIMSPGEAASIDFWMVDPAGSSVGCFPPRVTVTASMDCLPLPAVITNSPHLARPPTVVGPPYWTCCCTRHVGTLAGTVAVIVVSLQLVMVALAPPMVTRESVLQVALPAVGEVHRVPKP